MTYFCTVPKVPILSNVSKPQFGFSPQSSISGASHSQLLPALASQALRASVSGGNIQPHFLPLLLCVHPISRMKRPSSSEVVNLFRGLWLFASSIRYSEMTKRGFFLSGFGNSPTLSLCAYHCSRPVRPKSFCSSRALVCGTFSRGCQPLRSSPSKS